MDNFSCGATQHDLKVVFSSWFPCVPDLNVKETISKICRICYICLKYTLMLFIMKGLDFLWLFSSVLLNKIVSFVWKFLLSKQIVRASYTETRCSHMTLTWKTAWTFMGCMWERGFSFSLCLSFTHTLHTHINRVYPVLWTQRPLASRPEKTSLEAIGCPILFQAPHSQPHLFNAYIQSWGHEVGMWQGAKRALDLEIISADGFLIVAKRWTK